VGEKTTEPFGRLTTHFGEIEIKDLRSLRVARMYLDKLEKNLKEASKDE